MSTAELPIVNTPKSRLAPAVRIDWAPLALVLALALLAMPLIGSTSTWITLTFAGLAMGMIFFITASGLTLIFGLMDVLNFGHGLFIALGAYVAFSVLGWLPGWTSADNLAMNLAAVALAMLAAMVVAGITGYVFERVLIRRVYGLHLMQILITMGGLVVGQEIIKVVWDAGDTQIAVPTALNGPMAFGDATIEKYRLFALVIGIVVFVIMMLVLNRTKVGLLVRAGVQDREMVESLGYRINHLFVGVFVTGTALGGLGGVMWGLYQRTLRPEMGGQLNVLIFIVIIIGGMGSTGGSFVGAILVALVANYAGFLAPKVALISNILLMAAILAWRPNGLYGVTNR